MRYEYRNKADATKSLATINLNGLPKDIRLKFSNIHVRFYKVEESNDYFFCMLAIPKIIDDEGYVLEIEFSSIFFDENDLDFSRYEIPFQEHTFKSLPKSVLCSFEDKTEMGKRMFLLNMSIKGTPFNGYVLIDDDLYNLQ